MAYDFGGRELYARRTAENSQPDAMANMANLADVMLVFACGLMLALVSYWNLDLPTVTELDSSKMRELEDAEEMADTINSANAYIEKGTVYQDPNTGKLYWMIETDEYGNPTGTSGTGAGAGAGAGGDTATGGAGGAGAGGAGTAGSPGTGASGSPGTSGPESPGTTPSTTPSVPAPNRAQGAD
jgi:hypothetical protein